MTQPTAPAPATQPQIAPPISATPKPTTELPPASSLAPAYPAPTGVDLTGVFLVLVVLYLLRRD